MIFEKKGQMTIFVIMAIVLAAGIITYFVVRGNLGNNNVPSELEPVFNYYKECIRQETRNGASLAGSQGGYIDVPAYKPGTEFAPFSSELNFLGFPVPYWYYVSGNGLIKEQMPSKADISIEIGEYVGEELERCDFTPFIAQGYSIEVDEADVKVDIENTKLRARVISEMTVSKGEAYARISEHNIEINSKLGKFYDIARKIYEKQRADAVFETYAIDVLRLYTPVDGVEISCSGKVWKTNDVIQELKSGLEANIGALKFKGDYYNLINKKGEYYVIDAGEDIDENINLIYSREMPSKVEIVGEGVDDDLMIASPVGIQEGLGILGFCYAPYHFVYDASFPIMVQIYNNEEIFQFPVVVIIDNNVAREGVFSELEQDSEEFDLCEFMNQDIEVNIYDVNLERANANISYQCFNQRCRLGESKDGNFAGKAPSCLNGEILLRADGFSDKSEEFSTNKEKNIDIILEREYNVKLDLNVGGKKLDGTAIISFTDSNGESKSTLLPDSPEIKLSEGEYEIKIYVYGNSSITIPSSKRTQCQDVPRSGIMGFFGGTKEQCFDISIPETKIEYALRGGGTSKEYILADYLETGNIEINVDELPLPKSLEELQYNYASFEGMRVTII
ncbi:MAG: hypothetical protein Q7S27_04905 [Nanoarchaeota archaeon]|nr:hypothetical protein [Nanoarchaeota archaeon]